MSRVQIIVLGGLGRMGRAIIEAQSSEPDVDLKGVVVREGTLSGESVRNIPVVTQLSKIAKKGNVVIDVTRPDSVPANLTTAANLGTPYLLAVTGYEKSLESQIESASKKIPIVVAPNLSVGVAVLNEVVKKTAELLPETDLEILEIHHRNKKDAPSGTALSLAASAMSGFEKEYDLLLGRPAQGARNAGSIGIHAVRGGDVVGEHRVQFLMEGERLEFTHVATTRSIFAKGAIKAARFVARAKPGIYTMRDVLGLS